jgi:hypothetical protein
LIRSIPSFVTCISPLLLSDGIESQVLQAPHLELEKLEVHHRRPAVVLSFDILHARTFDAEDRHPSAVESANHHLVELSSSDQPEGSEEKVIGLEHRSPPLFARESGADPAIRRNGLPIDAGSPEHLAPMDEAVDEKGELV